MVIVVLILVAHADAALVERRVAGGGALSGIGVAVFDVDCYDVVRAVLLAGGARNVARAEGRGSEIILVRLG